MINQGPFIGRRHISELLRNPSAWIFIICITASIIVGRTVLPTVSVEKIPLDIKSNSSGRLFYSHQDEKIYIETLVDYRKSKLNAEAIEEANYQKRLPLVSEEIVYLDAEAGRRYYQLKAKKHYGFWSLLPAFVAIILCWLTREPLTSLLGGIVAGSFLMGRFNIIENLMLPGLMTKNAAGILILYLWLLGALMGIWSKTGAAAAFAEMVTHRFVTGPRSAKFVAWLLGVFFFQGGTVSTVLVGTTVKPIADKEKISHEELSYIVDSTASPIASLIPFNAWPGYVQAFLFVGGIPFLATEADRLRFFFQSVPLSFYSIVAVLGTLLLSIDKAPYLGNRMRKAIKRSRETGELDAANSQPLSAKELEAIHVPENYESHASDFFIPLVVLIAIALVTFFITGTPEVRWAFAAAVVIAALMALVRGMDLFDLIKGVGEGLKGVVLGSVILIFAIIIGIVSQETGGGIYLVELLGDSIPYWLLPVALQLLTIIIAFSTGTSWGTYAVAFPLAIPLAWAVAQTQGIENPHLFMSVCFAAVLNGSVYGDQCSPISDTTILSSMCTGCDLMDHVKTQMPPATLAALIAGIGWTIVVLLFV